MSRDTVVDRYVEPVRISAGSLVEGEFSSGDVFLQTSPEFAMKRLLAAGATSIYQICKAFRKGEIGRQHNPEFTMLEWYRVGDNLNAGIELLAELAMHVFEVDHIQKTTYREAFLAHASIDPFDCNPGKIRSVCQRHGVDVASFDDNVDLDNWLNLAMSEIVEPNLGKESPEVVYHWPASQSALANVCQNANGESVAERFELFYGGTELANGYHELQDAGELKRRNSYVNSQRISDGAVTLPEHSQLVEAMESGLPACSGVALGVDRLLMVLLKASSIDEVISFPFNRA